MGRTAVGDGSPHVANRTHTLHMVSEKVSSNARPMTAVLSSWSNMVESSMACPLLTSGSEDPTVKVVVEGPAVGLGLKLYGPGRVAR